MAALLGLELGRLLFHSGGSGAQSQSTAAGPASTAVPTLTGDREPTEVRAHNLLLRKGPQFRIYVRFIHGEMRRTQANVNPSFDDPDSFILEVSKGVIRANIGDLSTFLSNATGKNASLQSISIAPDGDQIVLHGTVHKIIPLPVAVHGTLTPTPDGRVRFHLTKLDVLKLPVKWLLGGLHVELADLMKGIQLPGVEAVGNDVFFDTEKLLPPPHIHGRITLVRVSVPDIEVVYGDSVVDEAKLSEWHNFLRLSGGTLDFGKLTMHHVDLTMIDASKDAWFDLDLVNYQAQLVNGYTRMTAQAGLEIFMPDLDDGAVKKTANQAISMEWLRDRTQSLPPDVPVH